MPGLLGTSLNADDILETLRGIGRGLNFGGTSGMIGAPVDMATAVLNNPGLLHPGLLGVQGLGIKDPVGGSKWIEQKLQNQGLLPQRQGNWQEGVGELASTFVNPMTAAAVAGPKLYAAEQRAIENAMAPTTLNKQAGAIVWHGSPHKFDKFDSSKIGTGEGAQAYGHGLYLAEEPATAATYANMRAAPNMEFHTASGRKLTGLEKALADDMLSNGMVSARAAAKANGPEWMDAFNRIKDEIITRGNMYKVDLPDTAIAKMLDWDKPLSKQAPEVTQALSDMWLKSKKSFPGIDPRGDPIASQVHHLYQQHRGGNSSAVAQELQQAGIPGIRYLDGGSRGTGAGTSNFVVFPGNEDLLRILERNGQPVGLLGR